MIKVLNGQWRGLGNNGRQIGINLDFEFRNIIHHFKGAQLHVFLAIILHTDQDGFCYPSYDLLQKETGYGREAVSSAVKALCAKEINGERVLIKWRIRSESGEFVGGNKYRVFPTSEEIEESLCPEFDFRTLGSSQSSILPQFDFPNSGKIEPEVVTNGFKDNYTNNIKETATNKNQPTNHKTLDQKANDETNNGWLVGFADSEEISSKNSSKNHNQPKPVEENATPPSPKRESEDIPASGAAESDQTPPDADLAMLALLDDDKVRIGHEQSRIDVLAAAGDLEGLLRYAGYAFDQDALGKVRNGLGAFIVGLVHHGYTPPRELSKEFTRSSLFGRHASEGIRAAASVQGGDGYRVPDEFADVIIG